MIASMIARYHATAAVSQCLDDPGRVAQAQGGVENKRAYDSGVAKNCNTRYVLPVLRWLYSTTHWPTRSH